MHLDLHKYLPAGSFKMISQLLDHDNLLVKVKRERKTRHGDYKKLPGGMHQITINSNLNEYRFLITLLHEIAHFEVYERFGKSIKPHGKEWKQTFKYIMLPFINPDIFPDSLLPLIANHLKNPKASSDTDQELSLALKRFDETNDLHYIFEVPLGKEFKLYNGKIFRKGLKRVKRFECIELKTGKTYLFNPNAEVKILE